MLGLVSRARLRSAPFFVFRLLTTLVTVISILLAPSLIALLPALASSASCEPAWKPVHSPGTAASGNIWNAVTTTSPEDAWVVGTGFEDGKTIPISGHWNGRKWTSVPMPVVGVDENNIVAVAGTWSNNVWAAGNYRTLDDRKAFFLHWNGEAWRHIPAPDIQDAQTNIRGITAIAADNVWAVGYLIQNPLAQDPIVESLIMHWDGLEWAVHSSPNPGTTVTQLMSINGTFENDIWAVGLYANDLSGMQPLAMHYDGFTWSVVPTPEFSGGYNLLTDVTTISTLDAWAVGEYIDTVTGLSIKLSLLWDGSNWSQVPVPTPQPSIYSFPLRGITAVQEDEVWALGHDYRTKKGFAVPLILRWDGTAWTRTPIQSLGTWSNNLADIAAAGPNDLWTVGYYTPTPPKTIPQIQHYGP